VSKLKVLWLTIVKQISKDVPRDVFGFGTTIVK
jgi:hypothetical protein